MLATWYWKTYYKCFKGRLFFKRQHLYDIDPLGLMSGQHKDRFALSIISEHSMMTSSNGNIFRVTGHLCVEFTGSPHKGQWRGALMFSLICVWTNGWVNNREAGDLRRHRGHYDVIVMSDDLGSTNYSSWQTWTHLFNKVDAMVADGLAFFHQQLWYWPISLNILCPYPRQG